MSRLGAAMRDQGLGSWPAAEVLAGLDGRIARYKIPRHGEIVEALPRNASGKLLKAELRRSYGGPTRGTT